MRRSPKKERGETRRITKDDVVPDEGVRLMRELLSEVPNRNSYLSGVDIEHEKHRDSTATEEPHLYDEFASSNALHGNFRMFAMFGKKDMLDKCLSKASPDLKAYFLTSSSQKHDETALTLAAKYARTEIVSLLLEHGQADLDHVAPGGTALTWTCRSTNAETFQKNEARIVAAAFALLYAGANANVENEHGHTALDYAVANESPALVGLLKRHGAQPGANPRSSSERCLFNSSPKQRPRRSTSSRRSGPVATLIQEETKEETFFSPEDLVDSTTFGLPASLKKQLVDALQVKPFVTLPQSSPKIRFSSSAPPTKYFAQANERSFDIEDQHSSIESLAPRLATTLVKHAKATVFGGSPLSTSSSSSSSSSSKKKKHQQPTQILAGLGEKLTYKIRCLTEKEQSSAVYQIDAESLQVLVVAFDKKTKDVPNGACPPCSNVDIGAALTGKVTFVQAKDHPTFINLQVNLLKRAPTDDLATLLYAGLDASVVDK